MRKVFRYPGQIKRNNRQGIPVHTLFLDTETYTRYSNDNRVWFPLRLGVCIYNRFDKSGKVKQRFISRFTTVDEFISILLSYLHKGKSLYIFGHNIGFDVRVLNLPYEFNKLHWISEPPIINNRVFIWRVKTPQGNLIFVDTANYAVISVAQLGHDLHFPKGSIDFRTKDIEKLFTYCQRDVEIIEKFMQDYIHFICLNKLGVFQVTLASQALMSWRTRFMTNPVSLHNRDDIAQFERSAYHGGRTECFYIAKLPDSDYYYLDVNSMYPYVMKQYPMPTKFICYSERIDLTKLPAILDKYYLIADCIINTDKPAYSILKDDKLIFPIGHFRATLHHAELAYAFQHNHIEHILGYCLYKKAHIFTDYVDWFYRVKQEATTQGNVSWRFIAKIFLNSLYGKMGQLQPIRIEIKGNFPDDIMRQTTYNTTLKVHADEIIWFGRGWYEYRKGESTYSFPAIAGAVTSYARMLLYKYIEVCGIDNVFYCDTDSIITNRAGYKNIQSLLSPSELGKLKLEKHSRTLRIWGNKDYKFGKDIKTKGISHKAKKLNEDTWEQLQFQGFQAWMSNQQTKIPFATKITKARRFKYNKGNVDPVTGKVTPFVLDL